MAVSKVNLISNLLKNLINKCFGEVNKALFKYQVKTGLILCAVEEAEQVIVETGEEVKEVVGDENGNTETEEPSKTEEETEIEVTIDGEAPAPEPEPAPEWVRELRKNHRELQKRNKELEEQVKQVSGVHKAPAELGEEPTLEGCDYDADKFKADLKAWFNRKAEVDANKRKFEEQQAESNRTWQTTLTGYQKAKTDLKVKDYEEAEEAIKETLSVVQQGIILQGLEANQAALVVYALGKNPKKAKELGSIKDPVKFAFAIAKLENTLKVTNRKTAPEPEKMVRGSAPSSGAVDSNLNRLRAEAEKTGDYSKVVAHRNMLKKKA